MLFFSFIPFVAMAPAYPAAQNRSSGRLLQERCKIRLQSYKNFLIFANFWHIFYEMFANVIFFS